MNKNQKGIAHLGLIVLVVLVIGGIAFAGMRVLNKNGGVSKTVSNLTGKDSGGDEQYWLKGCESKDRKSMTALPMNIGDVDTISPLGLIAGAHVTPIDHLYMYPKAKERDKAPVYAMADGYIVEIGSRGVMVDTGQERPPEYRIIMQHSCQTVSYFDLVTKLDDSIIKEIGTLKPNDTKSELRIPIKAGQEIGRIGGQSLDTAVYNFDMKLKGFISPELYEAEFWKIHTDDFFSYFSEAHQTQMQALNRRKVKPYSGKIDYDQPGKLIGNWFKEGTNGYAGPKETQNQPGSNGSGYWSGHMAIFYDAITPTTIILSFGNYEGQPKSFAVKGNAPDPASVSTSSGVVKYELVVAPNPFNPDSQDSSSSVTGTVLYQVLDGEKLKMELFPGKTASQVSGFTSAALTYER